MSLVDMGSLQQLQRLVCSPGSALPELSVLPAQLQQLELGQCFSSQQLVAVMVLQQLTALRLAVRFTQQETLLRLTQLPALQQLPMIVNRWSDAGAIAPALGQLPQLCELQLNASTHPITVPQLAAAITGVAAATTLTHVEFPCGGLIEDEQQAGAAAEVAQQQEVLDVCASIAGLTHLKHLELCVLDYVTATPEFAASIVPQLCHQVGDIVALTALTGLTHLGLPCWGVYDDERVVGDVEAVALACCLKQLRYFSLSGCELGIACLGAIAHLSQLTELVLPRISGLKQQGLMVLTRLSNLQRLGVDRTGEAIDEVVDSFWARLRGGCGH
jgi:hypothetical protein